MNYELLFKIEVEALLEAKQRIKSLENRIRELEEENLRLKIKANVKKVSDIIHNKVEEKVEVPKSFDPYYI